MAENKDVVDDKVLTEVEASVTKTEGVEERTPSREEIKAQRMSEKHQIEEQVDSVLKSDKEYKDLRSDVYMEMDAYTDEVRDGISFGAIIEGRGGTGKTWRVLHRMKDVDYAYTDSFSTPQAFYTWLYDNRNKEVIIVDDVAGLLSSDKVLAFLKGALWEVNGERILHYMTSKPLQNEAGMYVPNRFVLHARMIIITNKLNRKNAHLNAVLTRVNYCNVELDHDELMNILRQVTESEYTGLSKKERLEVYKFIEDNTSEANDDLNIRSLIKCFQHMLYSKKIGKPEVWKQLAMISILQKNPLLVIVEEIMQNPKLKTEAERVAEFTKQTGKSKSTFHRWRTQLELAGDKLKEPSAAV